jgi:sigma-E factor negative regulatory protein RseB
MINKSLLLTLLYLTSLSANADHPKEDIEKWLAKMHQAAHMINYDGSFVYGLDNEMSSMQIIHSVDSNGERERLISLDGSGREVIRSGDTVTCILPDKKSVVVDKSRPDSEFPPTFPLEITELSKNYDFHFGKDGIVAGQKAVKLMIKPKDKYRYGHALWIDSKTGLLLKDHLLDDKDAIVEQFMFTQVNYPKVIKQDRLKSKSDNKKFTWYKAKDLKTKDLLSKNEASKSVGWQVTNVPAGFVPGVKRHHNMTMSAMPVEHLMYSDGLSSISVFVEKKMKNSKNLIGGSTMGAVNAYGRSIGDYQVTVVGEVPHATVKLVGDSVMHVEQ